MQKIKTACSHSLAVSRLISLVLQITFQHVQCRPNIMYDLTVGTNGDKMFYVFNGIDKCPIIVPVLVNTSAAQANLVITDLYIRRSHCMIQGRTAGPTQYTVTHYVDRPTLCTHMITHTPETAPLPLC